MAPFTLVIFFHSTIGSNCTTSPLPTKYSQHNKASKSGKCFPDGPNKGSSIQGRRSSPQISQRANWGTLKSQCEPLPLCASLETDRWAVSLEIYHYTSFSLFLQLLYKTYLFLSYGLSPQRLFELILAASKFLDVCVSKTNVSERIFIRFFSGVFFDDEQISLVG